MKTEAKKQKSAFFFLFFCLWFMACGLEPVFANNIAVENVSLVDKDTGAPSATANWDAAWVFAKYSVYSGGSWSNWAHCTFLNTGYVAPSGSQMSFGATSSVYKGAFIYRSIIKNPA